MWVETADDFHERDGNGAIVPTPKPQPHRAVMYRDLSLSLSVCLSICLSLSISLCLSLPSFFPFVTLSVYVSLSRSALSLSLNILKKNIARIYREKSNLSLF